MFSRCLILCAGLTTWLSLALGADIATAQVMPLEQRPGFSLLLPKEPPMPTVADSSMAFIDTALIGSRIRLRYDDAVDIDRPTRSEFIWPVGPPLGPGPGPETSTDLQDLSLYGEWALHPGFSIFGELPYRWVDPQLNDSASGVDDWSAGFKMALRMNPVQTTTLQVRTFVPSGDGSRGLGTEHTSVEPALLYYRRLGACWALESELRDWIAIDGTDGFAGNVLRYGAGLSYQIGSFKLVGELIGWYVVDGQALFFPSPAAPVVEDAAGTTIVNLNLGLRWRLGQTWDIYGGYGQALTSDTWYDHLFRFECRCSF